jgi:hypothetical protein
VRRAFIAATPLLMDEGAHWYRNNQRYFARIDRVVHHWAEAKYGADTAWKIPS